MRAWVVVLALVLGAPLFAGCTALPPEPDCDDRDIVRSAVSYFTKIGKRDGGLPARPGIEADPKSTAWVLIATALARRSGQEGAFYPGPHLDFLTAHLDTMLVETTAIDSAANNLSLARAAFQAWGRRPQGIPVHDPQHADVTTLAEAWDARYDPLAGRYGTRLNEHLFGAFAAWVFDPPGERIEAMGSYVGDPAQNADLRTRGADVYTFDTWWAGLARSALGPEPANRTLARALDRHIEARTDGGTRGFADATEPDASSTAAAILGRLAAGRSRGEDAHADAVAFLCTLQRPTGELRFGHGREFAQVKTTAEVVIALSLWREPIPRGDGA